jgi:hypothetical protein
MVRLEELPDRCGYIFHAKENGPHLDDLAITANPYGFGEWFKIKKPPELDFAAAFATREAAYGLTVEFSKAEAEPVSRTNSSTQKVQGGDSASAPQTVALPERYVGSFG